MEKQKKSNEVQHNLRAKSPTIMSRKVKSGVLHCNVLPIPNLHGLNPITKVLNKKNIIYCIEPIKIFMDIL